ncbi:TetR/AcrR family transcriptional regulator [Nocardioides terrisoli]|uniref:TetR/AcrR family transcriptional regulator n=1 Tax=Nocardioides terrisoli TaxID=3388267 RepID=UPI00287BBC15|nr:helix-turn-helix domain-containing protein [Nocardioides marmorisolisilvae]
MPDPMPDPVLDAARGVFEQYGARRANMDDVAAAAGISRSTLYRRYPNKEELLAAVVTAELDAFFDELDRMAADLPPQEAVIECFARGLAIMRDIPVLGRLAQTEPEVISGMPDRGHMLLAQSDRVAHTLRRSGATMPDDELRMAAELLLRIATTYLLDPAGHLDLTDAHAVRDFAKRYLSPLVN